MKTLSVICSIFIFVCSILNSTWMKSEVCIIDDEVYEIRSESDLNIFLEEYGTCDSLVGTININADIDIEKLDFIRSLQRLRIDNFDADYPIFNQLELLNSLEFYTSKVPVLSGFNALKDSVYISIHNNGVLSEVNGFNSLDSIYRFWIDNQQKELIFKGFENVKYIQTIEFDSNELLLPNEKINLSVFDKVKKLEHLNLSSFLSPEAIIFPPNINLIDLVYIDDTNREGKITLFENIDSIGGFQFIRAPQQELITGMGYKDLDFVSHVTFYNGTFLPGSLNSIGDRFFIRNHPELSRCHVPSLCNYLESEDPDIRIFGNATGCYRQSEVEAACAALKACTIDNNGRNDVTLRTQTEVDDFISQYGACERIYGDVHIIGDHDLSGFNNIHALGRLKISGMEGTELVAFDSIRQLQRLELFENDNLESIDAFGMLESVTEELEFHRNPQLSSINGFQNLYSVGSLLINVYGGIDLRAFDRLKIITNELMVFNNPDLVSLDGLDSLSEIRNKISIHNNRDLNDLSALADLELSIDHLTISANPELSACEVASICNFLSSRPEDVFVNINNNNMGCDSEIEVLNACNIVAVHDIYHDIINLYPNPTDSRVYIHSDLEFIRYHLYDLHGRLIKTQKASSFINLESFTDGIYILVLESSDHQFINKKIVKK